MTIHNFNFNARHSFTGKYARARQKLWIHFQIYSPPNVPPYSMFRCISDTDGAFKPLPTETRNFGVPNTHAKALPPHSLPTYAHHSTPTPSLTKASSQLALAAQRGPSYSTSAERGLQPRPSSQIRVPRPPRTVTHRNPFGSLGTTYRNKEPCHTTRHFQASAFHNLRWPRRGNAIHTVKANSGIFNLAITSSRLANTSSQPAYTHGIPIWTSNLASQRTMAAFSRECDPYSQSQFRHSDITIAPAPRTSLTFQVPSFRRNDGTCGFARRSLRALTGFRYLHPTSPLDVIPPRSRGNTIHIVKANSGISSHTITSSPPLAAIVRSPQRGDRSRVFDFNDIMRRVGGALMDAPHIPYGIPVYARISVSRSGVVLLGILLSVHLWGRVETGKRWKPWSKYDQI
ncbi:hypothetical protein DFP72DRAFT_855621 [Ephemerocybe angulata]|uniref:Uncharacterized protein n=1 Tax=Ephemerocybe angulata TaxID=980116 RepID=A0A8H6HGX4_9AGAR|nr:hypothetical protein DFP72DRAFT_855621 [Tulosesus angulatus]